MSDKPHEYQQWKRVYGEGRYAACRRHADDALNAMEGGVVEVRRVTGHADKVCHCGQGADFYLMEVNVP